MIEKKILKSIFNNYFINKVIYIEEDNSILFLICSMNDSISLERWENLENVLHEYLNKKINLLPFVQASKFIQENYLKKGEIIQ